MKLRIKGDSLRLRLTRSELQQFSQAGSVEERTRIAPQQVLVYRLQRSSSDMLRATFENGVVQISVPAKQAREWCESDLVTLDEVQAHAGVRLRIVVEKDYACLALRADEEESDNFPHPDDRSTQCD